MSGLKHTLKAAKAALDAERFEEAIEKSNQVLKEDPSNYHARIFVGLAREKQGQLKAAEEAYKAAVRIKDNDALGWQGLVSVYEKQNGAGLDAYHDAALQLATIHMNHDDKLKCQTTIDKYTKIAQKCGSKTQYKRSLQSILPGSPVFEYLEGWVPKADHTYTTLAELCEAEEKEKINAEIGQRRTRLGARLDQVTLEVQREVLSQSPLEAIYAEIIHWTNDDDVRRLNEEKQLQHAYDTLLVLPVAAKKAKRKEVQNLARGLVILKHPFLLAWNIYIEWTDMADLERLDFTILDSFIDLFPENGLTKALQGFAASEICPAEWNRAQSEDVTDDSTLPGDALILMAGGLQDAPQSMLANRLVGSYYLYLDEFESSVNCLREGFRLIANESRMTGMLLSENSDAVSLTLATALIQFQTPRHHSEARQMFEEILTRKKDNTAALVGVGMIYEEQEQYEEAIDFLSQALSKTHNAKVRAEKAWCQALNGSYQDALFELESCLEEMDGSDSKSKALRSQTSYRIGMCMWSSETSRAARKDRKGAYARFISSLQSDINYAPAYTQLGIYYEDYGRDRKRALKCFHKAFELSMSEVEAAYRLAQNFAKSDEWDLVEVIAQRVIESGRTRPPPGSKKKPISWPFAALGVVQLNNQDFSKSLVSFQSALRDSPEDYYCWVGLGESYHQSGRYIAATKAFEHAQSLRKTASLDETWFTQYMLANVKREIGEYDDAIRRYEDVLKSKSEEYGVCLAYLQALVESAWRNIGGGFYGRAIKSANAALKAAMEMKKLRPKAFSFWKTVGDACSVFCMIPGHQIGLPTDLLNSLFECGDDASTYDLLKSIDHIDVDCLSQLEDEPEQSPLLVPVSTITALLAYKRAVAVAVNDTYAQAVAWYNLGWMEHRAYNMARAQEAKSRSSLAFLKASVQCFKRAIELEAGNSEFWNSLAIATCDLSPKVCQHAFVRSLYLNDRSSVVWVNLGAYYVLHNEDDLAHEAFTRAQSLDPAYAQSWTGQGLLSERSVDRTRARQLFSQAYEISDASNTMIKLVHARATFDSTKEVRTETTHFLPLISSLRQIQLQEPSNHASLRLLALFAERTGNFADAEKAFEKTSTRLESEYEQDESPLTISRFAQVKADIARLQLAQDQYADAIENATLALDLSDGGNEGEDERPTNLSSSVTAGSAHFHQDSIGDAIDLFKKVLAESDDDPDIVCLLCQLLWAKGGQTEREVARDQLLECIEKHPEHFGLTALLGCISALEDDHETADAVISDLQEMRARDHNLEDYENLAQLLPILQELRGTHRTKPGPDYSDAQALVMLAPARPENWSQLASISGEAVPAELAVLTATKAAPPNGPLQARDVCYSYAGTGAGADAQRAIMIAPFDESGWNSLQ